MLSRVNRAFPLSHPWDDGKGGQGGYGNPLPHGCYKIGNPSSAQHTNCVRDKLKNSRWNQIARASEFCGTVSKCDECVMLPSIPNFSGVQKITQ